MQQDMSASATPSSTFVTVVAWIFIVFTALGCLVTAAQLVMVHFMFSGGLPFPAAQAGSTLPTPSPFLTSISNHFELLPLIPLSTMAVAFFASIALLRRRTWARWAFIAIMGLGIVYNVGAVIAQFFFLRQFEADINQGSPDFQGVGSMFRVVQIFTAILATVISILFGWIIRKLCSVPIRAEFDRRLPAQL